MQRNEEIEAFKTQINLTAYAASQGFLLDKRKSSRNSAIMRTDSGDKIIVAKFPNRHWVYFSVHDERDSGTIIDFVQNRRSGSLGEVRKELRPWLQGRGVDAADLKAYVPDLEPISRDLAAVRARYEAMEPLSTLPAYLLRRGIEPWILDGGLFDDRIRIDRHKNVIFPHWNLEGISGYETKNQNYTGFAPGGEKGLWGSRPQADDKRLVICETAIDALSYAMLFVVSGTRFVSTAGQLNPIQPELIARAMQKLPSGGEIIVAVDNDEGGDTLLEIIQGLFDDLKLPGSILKIHRPEGRGDDWNEVLRASKDENGPGPAL